jgi:hypothetical protein
VIRLGRLILLIVLARWTWLFLVWPMRQDVVGSSFLHLIAIPFHEAGHVIFSPFGDLLTSLGGSLMQVLVPIACWIAFGTTSPNPFGMAVMCWWTGENLLDVAIYINDSRALNLILLGGHTGAEVEGHDWERILQLTGLLAHDHQIAWTVHAAGAIMMIASLGWGASLLLQKAETETVFPNSHERFQLVDRAGLCEAVPVNQSPAQTEHESCPGDGITATEVQSQESVTL